MGGRDSGTGRGPGTTLRGGLHGEGGQERDLHGTGGQDISVGLQRHRWMGGLQTRAETGCWVVLGSFSLSGGKQGVEVGEGGTMVMGRIRDGLGDEVEERHRMGGWWARLGWWARAGENCIG